MHLNILIDAQYDETSNVEMSYFSMSSPNACYPRITLQ